MVVVEKLKRSIKTPNYVPDYVASGLDDINFELLKNRGIEYIAFDADSTLVRYWGKKIDKHNLKYLRSKRKLFRKWCIASNRPINNLQMLGKSINAEVIRATLFNRKPSARYFKKVTDHFNAPPRKIAMIGDKLISDIWGANKAGFATIWVSRIGSDNPWDKIIGVRNFEDRLMRRYYSNSGNSNEQFGK